MIGSFNGGWAAEKGRRSRASPGAAPTSAVSRPGKFISSRYLGKTVNLLRGLGSAEGPQAGKQPQTSGNCRGERKLKPWETQDSPHAAWRAVTDTRASAPTMAKKITTTLQPGDG